MINIIILREESKRLSGLSTGKMPFAVRKICGQESMAERMLRRNDKLCQSTVFGIEADDFDSVKPYLDTFEGISYFIEPGHRGSAPLVSLIAQHYNDKTILVTPAWYDFEDEAAYAETVRKARELAETGKIVRIEPGILCFQSSVLLDELKKHNREFYDVSCVVYGSRRTTSVAQKFCGKFMDKFPQATITDALLSKMDNVVYIPEIKGCRVMDNYDAVYEKSRKDKNGNAAVNIGESYGVAEFAGAKNNMVVLTDRDVTLLGVEDIIVVDTGKKLLIARKGEDIEARLKELDA